MNRVVAGVLAAACAGLAWLVAPSSAIADETRPSFDCHYASSGAEKTICADPSLAALDRRLADVFMATANQGGIDGKALRQDEDRWLSAVRDRCGDASCLKQAYLSRIADLLDRSLRAASPAVYAETRPFTAPAALLSEAKSFIGTSCADAFSPDSKIFPGFEPVPGFATIIARDAYVVARAKEGVRFAFLLSETDGDLASCRIADVVALPSRAQAKAFLQCHLDDPPSSGFGMRLAGHRGLVAYWSLDRDPPRIERVPLGVLAAREKVRCQEPETGE